MPSFSVTYKAVDLEVIPKGTFGQGLPASSVRLQLGSYMPAAVVISSFVFYWFVLVPVVFPATKPKDPQGERRLKVWRGRHNLSLFLYSGLCCTCTAAWLYTEGQLFNWEALLCQPVEGTWLRVLSASFTLSKIVEWTDTAFLVWLGKHPPAFLHTYHHATTFWLFCFVMNMPGPEKFGLLMNGAVHTLMYSHYWRPWPKPLVPVITILQIAQLVTVIYAWTISPSVCASAPFGHVSSTTDLDLFLSFLTPYAFVPVFLWLFVVFFFKRFILKKPKKGGSTGATDDSATKKKN